VRFAPTAAGPKTGIVFISGTLLCNDVPLTAVGVEPPECQVTPTSLDFGEVYIGEHSDQNFTITNTGGNTLTGTVSESCDHYSIIAGGGPYSLGADDSVEVTVRYEPTSLGIHNCTIETGAVCEAVYCAGEGEYNSSVAIQESWSAWQKDHVEIHWILELLDVKSEISFEVSRSKFGGGENHEFEAPLIEHNGDRYTFIDTSTESDVEYIYSISVIASGRVAAELSVGITTPVASIQLYQNRPNPIRGSTMIEFALPAEGLVRLEVYDISGKKIRSLINRVENAGRYTSVWDGRDSSGEPVASGIYFYRLRMDGKSKTRTCALLR
ncbi:MAG: choice-of-anchor D domain-containing protein, partial [Candidatus Eisenbacteria bacterium]|nr:choice-of-anchor D domain-containing protein [Candidatus Eisenbacteria bacterium]